MAAFIPNLRSFIIGLVLNLQAGGEQGNFCFKFSLLFDAVESLHFYEVLGHKEGLQIQPIG